MKLMPEVRDWPEDGRMTCDGKHHKIKNCTKDPHPYVVRHQPGLSATALRLQLDLMVMLDGLESSLVPGRMVPKGYVH
jgi:hypothetical protein